MHQLEESIDIPLDKNLIFSPTEILSMRTQDKIVILLKESLRLMGGATTTLSMSALPVLLVVHPEANSYLIRDPISIGGIAVLGVLTGTFMGLRMLDDSLANLQGRETITGRLNRYLNKKELGKNKLLRKIKQGNQGSSFSGVKNIAWYYQGNIVPTGAVAKVETIENYLGFFPEKVIKENLDTVVIAEKSSDMGSLGKGDTHKFNHLPKSIQKKLIDALESEHSIPTEDSGEIVGMANRSHKILHVLNGLSGNLGVVVFHEMIHLMFLHGESSYYIDRWKSLFGESQEDQSEYMYHPFIVHDVNYGIMNAREDMATIAENMFSLEGWERIYDSIYINDFEGTRPGILRKKVAMMLEYFEKQSDGTMDAEYFRRIRDGKIVDANGAQEYFEGLN